MIRFLHLTDLHIRASDPRKELAALNNVLAAAVELSPPPSFVLISGDLTDDGDSASYKILADRLGDLPFPVYCALGNHDGRAAYRAVFSEADGQAEAPLDYDVVVDGMHLIVLDSSIPGRTSGGLDEGQFDFLATALGRHRDFPKLLMLHHPPKLTPPEQPVWASLGAEDTARLAELLTDAPPIAILSGHIHINRIVHWHGIPLLTTSGLQSSHDPKHEIASTGGLSIVEDTGFALCDVTGGFFSATFLPSAPGGEIRQVPADALKALL